MALPSRLPDSRPQGGRCKGSGWPRRRFVSGACAVGLGLGLGLAHRLATAQAAEAAGGSGTAEIERLLQGGGVVIAFRHALAPGTFDPPQFKLGDCTTQRNLSEEGRDQAKRMGEWFKQRGLQPSRVRSSPWCRCVETARLAFDGVGAGSAFGPKGPFGLASAGATAASIAASRVQAWPALGSPRGATEATNAQSLAELRAAVSKSATVRGFEVWVTHMFVLSDLTGQPSQSGEGLVLKPGAGGHIEVLGRLWVA